MNRQPNRNSMFTSNRYQKKARQKIMHLQKPDQLPESSVHVNLSEVGTVKTNAESKAREKRVLPEVAQKAYHRIFMQSA